MKESKIPGIGLRIIKSSIAILLCFGVDYLRGGAGIVFYSQLSALWCMQVYRQNTRKNAIQRTIGTSIGALYGLVFLLGARIFDSEGAFFELGTAVAISLMIIAVIYTTVLIKAKQASYFSCVVFLSIVVNHISDLNPYLFVWNRFLDTMIGILIGVTVNDFVFPRKKDRETLFISTMDETLLNGNEKMSDYSRVELNRMIDDGLNFTIATMRTPAIICETMHDIHMKYPVIAMDGAVLFDVSKKKYLMSYVISAEKAKELNWFIRKYTKNVFTNIVIDDTMLIYYEDTIDEVQRELVEKLRVSPYRNYMVRPIPNDEDVVYFMAYDRTEILKNLYLEMAASGYTKHFKIVMQDSNEHEGYSYLKVFNRNASMEHMMDYLLSQTGLKRRLTLGTIRDKYDVFISGQNANEAVKSIKKLYEY